MTRSRLKSKPPQLTGAGNSTPDGDTPRGKRVTAAHVAEHTGVSVATVSLVVNRKTKNRVTPETEARVLDAVNELGYKVDGLARSLSTGRRPYVPLISPDLTNPFFSEVTMGIVETLGDAYRLFLVVSSLESETVRSQLDEVLALRPSGIIVDSPSRRLLREIDADCPIVLLDAPDVPGRNGRINLDLRQGAEALADHLAELGHRRIAYLDAATGTPTFQRRRRYLIDRLRGHGVLATERIMSEASLEDATHAFLQALPQLKQLGCTAIVTATDIQAYGVLRAARLERLAIPDDLAVASFDDLPYSVLTSPSLTAVHFPAREAGRAAAKALRDVMEGTDTRSINRLLPTTLVVRASTSGLET